MILLAGEPGIGKSRVVHALRDNLREQRYTPLTSHCSPHHTSSALYPVIGLLERAAGFDRQDALAARLTDSRRYSHSARGNWTTSCRWSPSCWKYLSPASTRH